MLIFDFRAREAGNDLADKGGNKDVPARQSHNDQTAYAGSKCCPAKEGPLLRGN